MNSFALLADPVRRRIVEVLADGERPAGAVGEVIRAEFGVGQPAVSNQLRALRDAAVIEASPQGSRRIYRLVPGALDEVTDWIDRYARLWPQRLDALETELARGARTERPDPREDHDG
ncbi:ArsR family transcriptional regulator [Occultella glacieicola]|uniref:ArsR family transcriptional regulator n=1 Tax=Occultella glacieicola TaxID=2518684 RepID=A0ABY2E132_9MICO|nr:metalloregulator ArsR/SmtB family transcription factor [Occultella glacieicola]TDE91655.1 ArsR family transcriptional regulator [Occultella glacieicola]